MIHASNHSNVKLYCYFALILIPRPCVNTSTDVPFVQKEKYVYSATTAADHGLEQRCADSWYMCANFFVDSRKFYKAVKIICFSVH